MLSLCLLSNSIGGWPSPNFPLLLTFNTSGGIAELLLAVVSLCRKGSRLCGVFSCDVLVDSCSELLFDKVINVNGLLRSDVEVLKRSNPDEESTSLFLVERRFCRE